MTPRGNRPPPGLPSLDLLRVELMGRNRLEASAGTGKTRAVAILFLRLLLEDSGGRRQPLPVSGILVVTYTEAAAQELAGRIRGNLRRFHALLGDLLAGRPAAEKDESLLALADRIGEEGWGNARIRLDLALRDFDRAAISTIHGFCARVLRDRPFESGAPFVSELLPDESDLLAEAVDDFLRRTLYPAHPLVAGALAEEIRRGDLLAVGRRQLQLPRAALLPPPGGHGDDGLLVAADALRASFTAARKGWREGGTGLLADIRDSATLGRDRNKSYQMQKVVEMGDKLDAYFASPAPVSFPGEALDLLGARRLNHPDSHLARKRDDPDRFGHAAASLCDALFDARAELGAAARVSFAAALAWRFPARMADLGLRSYQDLLTAVDAAVGGAPDSPLAASLRTRWPAALIDEFQDTDPLQFRIFDAAWRGEEAVLFLVGDPKQSIYGFRGADLYAYLDSAAGAGGEEERRHPLSLNHRSAPRLVAAVNSVFSARPGAFLVEGVEFAPAAAAGQVGPLLTRAGEDPHPPLRLWLLPRPRKVSKKGGESEGTISRAAAVPLIEEAVADEVVRLLAQGRGDELLLPPRGDGPPRGLLPRDIAILVRSHAEAAGMRRALRRRAVPCVLGASGSVWETPTAEELFRLLLAVADPGDDRKVRSALATPLLGVDGGTIAAMEGQGEEWERWAEEFLDAHARWSSRGLTAMAWGFLARHGVRARLLGRPEGERRLTDLLHAVELLDAEASARGLGIEGVLRGLSARLADPAGGDEAQLRLESDEDALRISTVHGAKGLQWPIVFCPFSWGKVGDPIDPYLDYHDDGRRPVLDLRSAREREGALGRWRRERKAEEVRLLYVALTRASHRCYATWGALNGHEGSAMNWLLHGRDAGLAPDQLMRAELEALAKGSRGGISVTRLPAPEAGRPRLPLPPAPAGEVRAARLGRELRADWSVSSFSAMAGSAPEPHEREAGRDEGTGEDAREQGTAGEAPDLFPSLPPGARAGTFLHELLQGLDFSEPRGESARRLAARLLLEHDLAPDALDEVLGGLARVLAVPIGTIGGPMEGDAGIPLCSLPARDRRAEMGFFLPRRAFTARDWARALRRHGGEDVPALFPERIELLELTPTGGLLAGSIDLVFRAGGRYHLLDWKSNRLPGYGREELARAMGKGFYLLQAHLYAAALHRHLERTLPGYDFDRHFGSVSYLFLRGMGREEGVWRGRPSRKLIEALYRFFTPEGAEP